MCSHVQILKLGARFVLDTQTFTLVCTHILSSFFFNNVFKILTKKNAMIGTMVRSQFSGCLEWHS